MNSSPSYTFDWSEFAFKSKKPMNQLRPIFIAAPREISPARFTELVKAYLPQGNIVLGFAKEDYITGFEGQPQFKAAKGEAFHAVIDKVNASQTKHKVYILSYFQRESRYIFEKLDCKRVVLINGSWHYAFHTRESYYILASRKIDFDMVSPFVSEAEAKAYEARVMREIARHHPFMPGKYTEIEMMAKAEEARIYSFDYNWQTGLALGKRSGKKYELLAWSCNQVVPYQTFAMHYGASRERHFSPPHDLNHYDTVHAEVELIIKAQRDQIDLSGSTIFINTLPCPACSRMFMETDIDELVYQEDHSDGYAVKMLTLAGKRVRRIQQS